MIHYVSLLFSRVTKKTSILITSLKQGWFAKNRPSSHARGTPANLGDLLHLPPPSLSSDRGKTATYIVTLDLTKVLKKTDQNDPYSNVCPHLSRKSEGRVKRSTKYLSTPHIWLYQFAVKGNRIGNQCAEKISTHEAEFTLQLVTV